MVFIAPDFTSTVNFTLIILAVLNAFIIGSYVATKDFKFTIKMAFLALGYVAVFSFVVVSGWAYAQPMPRVMILFLSINVLSILFAFSGAGKKLFMGLSFSSLVLFQVFRLPLELVLHDWSKQGSIPTTMTWTGKNFDIISGIAALALFYFANKSKKAAWAANIIGFVLLLNVIRVATLSSPLPFAWEVSPPLQLIFFLPYALIGPICVGGALIGHILLTRKLLANA